MGDCDRAFLRAIPIEPSSTRVTVRGPDFGPFQLTGESGIFRALITETASLPFADLPVSRLAGGDWTFERAPTETFAGFQQTFRCASTTTVENGPNFGGEAERATYDRMGEPWLLEQRWRDGHYERVERPIGPVHGCLPGAGLSAFRNNTHGRFVEDPC